MIVSLKLIVVWIALLAGGVLGGVLLPFSIPGEGDGPFTAEQAFLLVNFLHAIVLTALASQAAWQGSALGLTVAVVFLFAQSLLLLVEALWFNAYLEAPVGALLRAAGHTAFQAALAGSVTALLWRRRQARASSQVHLNRLPVAAALYVLCYFAGGTLIALSSPWLRDYYNVADDRSSEIALVPLLAFQYARGIVWAGLAYVLARMLGGAAWSRGVLAGLTFGILASASLFYPTAFMPWSVRGVHIVEVLASNTLFGWGAVLIFMGGQAQRPSKDDPTVEGFVSSLS
ncbi:MAG: hypothetical protein AAF830_03945 [Pseudomonadota bacterium]